VSTVRVAFLGTPEFARFHLQHLLQDPHFEVVGVVTQPDRPSGRHMHLTPSPVKKLALEKGLPVITPESMKVDAVLEQIALWRAEAAVVVAYGQILPQKFLDLFPQKVVNVHGSILPRWRGAAPIQRAIEAGDTVSGVSLQVMVRKLDAGDVIGSRSLEIQPEWNSNQLHDAMMPLGADLLHVEFMDYLRGNLTPVPQDEGLVTYAHKIDKSEALIDWKKSALAVCNHMRAMVMGPGSYTYRVGSKLKIIRAEVVDGIVAPAGQVVEVNKNDFVVACGEKALRVLQVQPESRPAMPTRDYLLGHALAVGEMLGAK
jgi:methionyl-tRNA formyltransferase